MKKSLIIVNSLTAVGLVTAGYFAGKKVKKKKIVYAGTLWVDESEPNGQTDLYAEFHIPVKEIAKSDVITLKVIKK